MTWSQTDQIRPSSGHMAVWKGSLKGSVPLVMSNPSEGSSQPHVPSLRQPWLLPRKGRKTHHASSTSWEPALGANSVNMITLAQRANLLPRNRLPPRLPLTKERVEGDQRNPPPKPLAGTLRTVSAPGLTVRESTEGLPLLRRKKRMKSRRQGPSLQALTPGNPSTKSVSIGRSQAHVFRGTPACTTMQERRRSRRMPAPGRTTATITNLDYL